MPKYNVEHLANIHKYHNDLQRQIDEADWIGQYESVEYLRKELELVKESMNNGDVYYPLF